MATAKFCKIVYPFSIGHAMLAFHALFTTSLVSSCFMLLFFKIGFIKRKLSIFLGGACSDACKK